jgi:DNA-binding CsgD family transcriptional regulator
VTRTAVVIEPSRPPEIATLLLQAYGLLPRELEIAQLLLAGLSVPHIARLLMLSPYTARDHLKSIFQKVGVNSKQELAKVETASVAVKFMATDKWRNIEPPLPISDLEQADPGRALGRAIPWIGGTPPPRANRACERRVQVGLRVHRLLLSIGTRRSTLMCASGFR